MEFAKGHEAGAVLTAVVVPVSHQKSTLEPNEQVINDASIADADASTVRTMKARMCVINTVVVASAVVVVTVVVALLMWNTLNPTPTTTCTLGVLGYVIVGFTH